MEMNKLSIKSRSLFKLKKIDIFAFAFSLLSLLKCWIYARQSGNDTTVFICDCLVAICSLVVLLYICTIYRLKICNIKFVIFPIAYVLIKALYRYDGKINIQDAGVTVVTIAIIYLLLPEYCQYATYNFFRKIVILCALIGIIFFIAYCTYLPLPYNLVPYYGITQANAKYADFYNIVLFISSRGMVRLCGPFNEPGLMGTFCGLLLVAENINLKKKGNVILLIAGGLTFSVAFIVIISTYYLYKYRRNWRTIFLVIIIFFFILMLPYIQFKNPSMQYLVNRVINFEDNRTTREFDAMFSEFIKTSKLWLGYGSGFPTVGVLSIKTYILDMGIIGTISYLVYILKLGLAFANKNRKCLVFLFIFMMSMYQRPDVISPGYFIILIGGMHGLNDNN